MQANRRSAHLRHALRRLGAGLLAAAGVGLLTSGTAWAEAAFPNKTVRLVVPYPAGGATDVLGRAVADGLVRGGKREVHGARPSRSRRSPPPFSFRGGRRRPSS